MLMDLSSAHQVQAELCFDGGPGIEPAPGAGQTAHRDPQRLMAALDAVNQRWGKHAMKLGSNRLAHSQTPSPKGWVMKQERRTPRYTTQWEEMPLVRA
jgi:DNA polymerase V